MNSASLSSFSMYVVSHKDFDPPAIDGYTPIAVGSLAIDPCCAFVRDNTGDNISAKNPNYCELTALYWIWKNDLSSDVIGFCHYRRYFSTSPICCNASCFLTGANASKTLLSHDLILPSPFYWPTRTVGENYYLGGMGHEEDLRVTRDVVAELTPEYLAAFDGVMISQSASYCNMLVAPRRLFDEYCLWLFSVLAEVEKRIDISCYSVQEARVFGYLSELLLNVWVSRNSLSAALLPVVNPERGFRGNAFDRLKNFRDKVKTRRG